MTKTITRLRGDLPELVWPTELDDASEFCLGVRAAIPHPIYGPAYNDWDRTFRAAAARCAHVFAAGNGLRRGEPFNVSRLLGQRTGDARPQWYLGLQSSHSDHCIRGEGFAAAPAMIICHADRMPDLSLLPDSLAADIAEGASWVEPGSHVLFLRRGLPTIAEGREVSE